MGLLLLFFNLFFLNGPQDLTYYDQSSVSIDVDTTIVISRIEFLGNRKTNSDFLFSFLGLSPKENYTIAEIKTCVNKLQQVFGIYNSHFELEKQHESYLLKVYVEEQKTILPIFAFGVQPQNKWAQIGFAELNLWGKGDELWGYYQNNQGRHSGQFFYKDRYFLQSKYDVFVQLLSWNSVEPINTPNDQRVNYQFGIDLYGTGVERRIREDLIVGFDASYFREKYKSLDRGDTGLSLDLNLNKYQFKWRLNLDRLKYNRLYKENYQLNLDYQTILTPRFNQLFHQFSGQLKYYDKLSKKTEFASRLFVGVASNFNSPFAPFVVDSYVNVRAAGNRILRATGLTSISLEVRQELITYKALVLQAVVFNDNAIFRQPGEQVILNKLHNSMLSSVGTGMRIHYQDFHNAILRIDYGINLSNGNKQWLIGIGQFF